MESSDPTRAVTNGNDGDDDDDDEDDVNYVASDVSSDDDEESANSDTDGEQKSVPSKRKRSATTRTDTTVPNELRKRTTRATAAAGTVATNRRLSPPPALKAQQEVSPEDAEARKKRVNAIWEDMKAGTGGIGSSARKTPLAEPPPVSPPKETGPKPAQPATTPTPKNGANGRGSAGPRRLSNKLEKVAERYGVDGKSGRKLNTLEKSKKDWAAFVSKEGIEDDLKQHNKDGYLEKVAFLQRTDERQAEMISQLKKKRSGNSNF
ncbi:bucentaur or craniofacial development-domain-containing protein [Cladochytrium replicatum]|nr:bucentaur or craniofacial development-domain-containing protein [Cladochytrium replicatum]